MFLYASLEEDQVKHNGICFVYLLCHIYWTLFIEDLKSCRFWSLYEEIQKQSMYYYFTTYNFIFIDNYMNYICIKLSEDQKMIITKSIQDKEELFEISD